MCGEKACDLSLSLSIALCMCLFVCLSTQIRHLSPSSAMTLNFVFAINSIMKILKYWHTVSV